MEMKHCIIAKFNESAADKQAALAQVRGVDKDELAAKLSANARALADGVCTLAV